jgi:hypothetical protein
LHAAPALQINPDMSKVVLGGLLALMLVGVRPARAEGPMDFTSSQEIRSAGKALTAIGVLAHVASIPLIVLAAIPDTNSDHAPYVASGAALTALSAVSVGVGAGLWGASNGFDRAERKLSLAPTGVLLHF